MSQADDLRIKTHREKLQRLELEKLMGVNVLEKTGGEIPKMAGEEVLMVI